MTSGLLNDIAIGGGAFNNRIVVDEFESTRVCHFCETSVDAAYFKNIAAGLVSKGVRVSMVELGEHQPPIWLNDVPGTDYYALRVKRKAFFPVAVWRIARLMRREKFNILQTHLFNAGLIGVLAKRFAPRTIVVLTRHHTSVVRLLGTRVHIALDKWMAERADHVVTVSEAARDYMREVDHIDRDIDVVHLGFDFDRYSPNVADRERIRSEFGFSDDHFVIGYVANFAPGKGHIELVEAFASFAKDFPKARLFLVGKGRLREVEDAIGRSGLGRRITFAGWRQDTEACLNAMDLFIQPSLSEAFSQVLVEAMGVGLPVIATDVGGAKEVIEHGVTGFLIPPCDVVAIADSIKGIISNQRRANTIAIAGQARVKEQFTVERMVAKQFDLYKRWLGET